MPIIDVIDELKDGWHSFTSPQVPGFFIVAPADNVEAAYADIPRAIERLFLQNRRETVTVRLERIAKEQLRQYCVEPIP